MKEKFKEISIGDRKFRIGKFDALTGSYIAYAVLTQLLPLGLGNMVKGLESIAADPSLSLPVMPKEKFVEIQKDCLMVCSEITPVGNTVGLMPVLLADGRWGIEDLEHDAPTILLLTVEVLGYNVQSFFDENVLKAFGTLASESNLLNAKI